MATHPVAISTGLSKNVPMSADNEPADTTATVTSGDETRRKFREALEAKKGRSGEAHVDPDAPKVHAHGPVNEKRVFRRKTG